MIYRQWSVCGKRWKHCGHSHRYSPRSSSFIATAVQPHGQHPGVLDYRDYNSSAARTTSGCTGLSRLQQFSRTDNIRVYGITEATTVQPHGQHPGVRDYRGHNSSATRTTSGCTGLPRLQQFSHTDNIRVYGITEATTVQPHGQHPGVRDYRGHNSSATRTTSGCTGLPRLQMKTQTASSLK